MKVPVCVVILARNEASRIADCIRSVQWADEIIVVDDESTDETGQIAESLGARVLRRKMEIEGRHRNWAYAQAQHPWVLSLDADERITPELAREIAQVLTTDPPFNSFVIPMRNYLGAVWLRHGGWYPAEKLRLFRKDQFRYEETFVHPRAFIPHPQGRLQHEIIHQAYRDFEECFEKLNRHTSLEAKKWMHEGRKVSFGHAIRRSVDRTLRALILKRGYRDGFVGFVMSLYQGWYQWLTFAKYWELTHPHETEGDEPTAQGPSPSMKAPVSVVVLTKNEAHQLAACLRTVQWAAELLVVDDQSTDTTRKIAEQFASRVIVRPMDNEGRQRNWAYAQATQPWILSLDADERVSPALRDEIIQKLYDGPSLNGYGVPRRTYIGKRWVRHGGWYPSEQLKLFRKGHFWYDEAEIHPKANVKEKWGSLRQDLLHFSYHDMADFFRKVNHQTTLEAKKWIREGRRMSLGHALWRMLDRFVRALVLKHGYRDGILGLVVASFASLYQLLSFAKYWGAEHMSSHCSIRDVERGRSNP